MRCFSVVGTLYFRIFWFLPSSHFCVLKLRVSIHVPVSLSPIMVFGLLLGTVPSVCTCSFHHMTTLLSLHVSTNVCTCLHQCPLCNFTRISLHVLKWIWTQALLYLFTYWFFASIEHADITWSVVSSGSRYCMNLLSVSVWNVFVAW